MTQINRQYSNQSFGSTLEGNFRRLNRRLVLEAILSHQSISRTDLTQLTRLSASTVGLIVNELIAEGILAESGTAQSTRGRKPIVVELQPRAATIVGIDLNELTGSVFDLESQPCMDYVSLPSKDHIEHHDVIRLIQALLQKLPPETPLPRGIGISVPGIVDTMSGHVLFSSNLGWADVPLGRLVAGETGLPVIVEPNRICLAMSEAWSGVARGIKNFIYFHVGWRGVGAGLVMNGSVVRGAHHKAGEIGHLQVFADGPQCHCGKWGCLEMVATGRAIMQRVQMQLDRENRSNELPASFAELAEAARQGHDVYRQALEEAGRILGDSLASLVATTDPELVVLGGSTMAAKDVLLPVIEDLVRDTTLVSSKPISIVPTQDSKNKSAMGIARIASRRLLLDVASEAVGTEV